MRSLIFCLLASVAFVAANKIPDYCEISPEPGCKASDEPCECDNKKIDNYVNDLSWTINNAFDNRKVVPKDASSVTIDIQRALYVETSSEDSSVTFKMIKAPCKQLYYRIDDIFYLESDLTIEIPISKNKKAIFAVFHPECELLVKKEDFKNSKLYHIFLRSQITKKFEDGLFTNTNGLGSFIEASQKYEIEENIPTDILKYNSIFPFDSDLYSDDNKKKECYHMCKQGSIIEFELVKGLDFGNIFKLGSACEWMTVHIHNDEMGESAEISMRHGFVTLPHELKAFPMDFEDLNEKKPEGYEVTVVYYVKDKKSHMIIANAHGRSVHTKQLGGSTDKIVFAFSNDNCLSSPIGDFELDKSEDDNLKKFPFKHNLNIGFGAASVTSFHAFRFIKNSGSIQEENYEANKDKGISTKTDEKPPDVTSIFENINPHTTTTPEPIDTNVTIASKPPPIFESYNGTDMDEEIKKNKEDAKKAFENAIKKDVYLYWAIPAGFCTGSFSSFIIGNILLFLFKRTVMNFWYKAMYKRYGSDTTMGAGTTMGKTGAGETIGGSTTVGGGTTMGGTTAGETGSTTAA